MEKKTCSQCKKTKNLSFFFIEKKAKSGFRSECKECTSKYKKQWNIKYKEKNKIRNNKWREKNKEKIKEKGTIYRNKNKRKISEEGCKYYLKNQSKIKKRVKNYYLNNKEKISVCSKIYRINNKEKIHLRRQKYRLENKEKIKKGIKRWANTERGRIIKLLSNSKRRALKKSVDDGTINLESVKKIWIGKCKSCNRKILLKAKRSKKYHCHLDHIIPLSKGGKHTIKNVQWLCSFCNISKFNNL